MATQYFAGKGGAVKVDGFDAPLKVSEWNYVSDKSLLEITNSLSFAVSQYIPTIVTGSITLQGFVTDAMFNSIITPENLVQGQEVKVDLYFKKDGDIGFTNIDAIIDEFDYTLPIDGVGTYKMTLLRNEPKI